MDFTGRRQSDNVDDRRKNWRIYEAFRPLPPQSNIVASNQHTDAVDRAPELTGRSQPLTQESFDFLLETEPLAKADGKTVRYRGSVIDNLLRK